MVSVIIVAGGRGKRMNSEVSKQFLTLGDKMVLEHTVEKFLGIDEVDEIILVMREEEHQRPEFAEVLFSKPLKKAVAGEERYLSVRNGLQRVDERSEVVLVHDGARPFVRPSDIRAVIEKTKETGACILASKVKDTIKEVKNEKVSRTLKRELLYCVATPQGFDTKLLKQAYSEEWLGSLEDIPTDDAAIVEAMGKEVFIVEGSTDNIKITTPVDLLLGELILKGENS